MPTEIVTFRSNSTFNPNDTLLEVQGPCELCSFYWQSNHISCNFDIYIDGIKYKIKGNYGASYNYTLFIPYSDVPISHTIEEKNSVVSQYLTFVQMNHNLMLVPLKVFAVKDNGYGQILNGIWKPNEIATMSIGNSTLLPRIKAKNSIVVKVSDTQTGPVNFDIAYYFSISKFKE